MESIRRTHGSAAFCSASFGVFRDELVMVRRILVKGASGAGKSTLAFELARHLGLRHVELDALHWGPNWTAASAPELQARLLAVLDDDRGWVVDGNYDSKLGTLVIDRAELIVWVDLPLQTKLLRLVARTSRRWIRNEELWNGNRETLKDSLWGADALFPWAVRSHFRHRRQWSRDLAGRRVVRLRSTHEVDAWFSDFCARSQRHVAAEQTR
jgi:adenylate kinase family enzyme